MKKNIIAAIFPVACLLMVSVLSVGFLINGPSQAGANERLSSAPVLVKSDGKLNGEYLADVSEYFSDHFYLRQELISAHNGIVAGVFGSSAEEDVILGSDGWLYYEPTLGDYTGTAAMTGRELWCAAINLALMQEYCESQGADFVFAVAPNKNSLYDENMPSYGVKAESHDAQRLFEMLDYAGVSYVDLFAAFKAEEEVLYFAHDSHWNSRGAALGADLINEVLGSESSYYSDAFAESENHSGDLFEMLYPAGTDSEENPVYGGALSFEYSGGGEVRPDSITINTTSGGEGSLLAFRDSFGNLLYPYLADSYGAARFSRAVSNDLSQMAEMGTTDVLIELVERNLSYLVTYYPLMPAPEREREGISEAEAEFSVNEKAKAPEGCVLVTGSLAEECFNTSSIYVICGDTAYEAFCLADGAFAAYIPAEAAVTGIGASLLVEDHLVFNNLT